MQYKQVMMCTRGPFFFFLTFSRKKCLLVKNKCNPRHASFGSSGNKQLVGFWKMRGARIYFYCESGSQSPHARLSVWEKIAAAVTACQLFQWEEVSGTPDLAGRWGLTEPGGRLEIYGLSWIAFLPTPYRNSFFKNVCFSVFWLD